MPPAASSPYRLFVEGKDDKHSICNLLERHGYDWNGTLLAPFVYDSGGIEPLLEALPSALKTYVRVGMVVDADLSPTNRWARIAALLGEADITPPSAHDPQGTVVSVAGPARLERFGVWIMPDNRTPGVLEDFLKRLVPASDTCWQHADASTSKARALGAPLNENDHAKGAIHTWLAWQDPPGQPFGTALNARILSHDSLDAIEFVAWFRRLFGA